MNLKKEVGKRIQQIRRERKLTQEQLAELIHIETISLSKIETGKSYPTSENLAKIAQALNAEPYEFYIFENSKTVEELKQEIISSIKSMPNNYKKLIEILHIVRK